MDFTGKVLVVTGGANGIGRAAAEGFARGGGRGVVIVDRDPSAGAAAADAVRALGCEALFVAADVSRSEDVQGYVKAALDRFGRIDCFLNNAGIEGRICDTAEYDEAVFDRVIAVNLRGCFLGLRHVLPVMQRQGAGAIVNTSSTAGVIGTPRMPAYAASKHAVIGLTKTAAGEVARQGIRVNAVCPGPTDTNMLHSIEGQINPADPEAVGRSYRAAIPTGRYAGPDEVANMMLFLLSDMASGMTGAHILVDGGRTASPASVTTVAR
jgi:NAD(P)-dependent dehydrogenase (short-subunit alcohol dehydrogenase family)